MLVYSMEILEKTVLKSSNWTVAIFNAFETQPLEPNESRTIEIGFNAPNINLGSVDLELEIMPQSFPQRANSVKFHPQ